MMILHLHPWVILAECTGVHTLRKKTSNPPGHVLKCAVPKGTLLPPVSSCRKATLSRMCLHPSLLPRSGHGPFSEGAGTTDLTEGSIGVATTGQTASFPAKSFADLLMQV